MFSSPQMFDSPDIDKMETSTKQASIHDMSRTLCLIQNEYLNYYDLLIQKQHLYVYHWEMGGWGTLCELILLNLKMKIIFLFLQTFLKLCSLFPHKLRNVGAYPLAQLLGSYLHYTLLPTHTLQYTKNQDWFHNINDKDRFINTSCNENWWGILSPCKQK